jgi:hypothetical protein
MANYPVSVTSFATKSNGQIIDASHVNTLQDEVAAVEGGLLNGFAHDLKSVAGTRLTYFQSMVRAESTGNIPVANNLVTLVGLGSEDFDTDTLHDLVTNNSRLTAAVTGKYQVSASVIWNANSSGIRQLHIQRNTSNVTIVQTPGSAIGSLGQNCSDLMQIAQNGFVEMSVYQNTGSTGSLASASLTMVYVGK